jgi:hypothetical protein
VAVQLEVGCPLFAPSSQASPKKLHTTPSPQWQSAEQLVHSSVGEVSHTPLPQVVGQAQSVGHWQSGQVLQVSPNAASQVPLPQVEPAPPVQAGLLAQLAVSAQSIKPSQSSSIPPVQTSAPARPTSGSRSLQSFWF